ncbi:hypothetical protein Tco_1061994, partial [Tanacetum coccineum]
VALPDQNLNNSAFRSMLKREKLFGPNFNNWFHQLRIFLRVEEKLIILEKPITLVPAPKAPNKELEAWNAQYDRYNEVACLMLGIMSLELQRQFENYSPYDMLHELKFIFEKQVGVERFDLIQTFHACKQKEGQSISSYVLKMKLSRTVGTPWLLPNKKPQAAKVKGKEVGDWERNCLVYLVELMKKKKQAGSASTSGFVTRILNIVPIKNVDKTVSNMSYLEVWGYDALVKRDMLDKLQQRYVKCIFVGYPQETMSYYFYFPPENKIVVARYLEFIEKNLITQEASGRAVKLEEIQEDSSPSKNTSKHHVEAESLEP